MVSVNIQKLRNVGAKLLIFLSSCPRFFVYTTYGGNEYWGSVASSSTNSILKKRNGCLRQTCFSAQQKEEIDRTISLVLFFIFSSFFYVILWVYVWGDLPVSRNWRMKKVRVGQAKHDVMLVTFFGGLEGWPFLCFLFLEPICMSVFQ